MEPIEPGWKTNGDGGEPDPLRIEYHENAVARRYRADIDFILSVLESMLCDFHDRTGADVEWTDIETAISLILSVRK